MFIAIDGIDGAGKTTLAWQLGILFEPLHPKITKEPTEFSEWGRALRASAKNGRLARDQEIDYFHRDRLYHIKHIIRPALRQKRLVITDRYVDSTLAFQARNCSDAVQLYARFAREILLPDLTFILKCPVEIGLDRLVRRGKLTSFETLGTLERARSIYESRNGPGYHILDATGSVDQTLEQALNVIIETWPMCKDIIRRADKNADVNIGFSTSALRIS